MEYDCGITGIKGLVRKQDAATFEYTLYINPIIFGKALKERVIAGNFDMAILQV